MRCNFDCTFFLYNFADGPHKNVMTMKKQTTTLLALCLLGTGLAFGQNTMNGSSSSTTTTPTTTDGSTNATTTNGNGTLSTTPTTNGDTNNSADVNATTNGTTAGSTTNGTFSSGDVNGTAPRNSTYSTSTTTSNRSLDRKDNDKGYKAFTFGVYVGANSTHLRGESSVDLGNPSGRVGYQVGVLARGGGRLYGQIGVEYFASSSNYFQANSLPSLSNISSQINTKYLQVPVYIGYKLTQSDRGISAIRVQVGAEYANQLSNSTSVSLNNAEFKSGSFNALGNLGFDFGPVFIDLVYHHGLSNTISGFDNSRRRILSASLGFKF